MVEYVWHAGAEDLSPRHTAPVGHVYALLMQEHRDDAKVRALMKQYGWLDMVHPKATASSE